jgi:SP family myo-inositol transporter-like MFS transporter 13
MAGDIDATENLKFVSQYCPTKFSPMIVVGLMLYLVSFQSGLGPIPWIVNSEVFGLLI